jgi:hypothetical protein
MTQEEEKLVRIGRSCQVYHATQNISEEVHHMKGDRLADFIQWTKRHLYIKFMESLYKDGLFFERDNSNVPGDRTITVSIMCAKPGDKDVENLVQKDALNTRQALEDAETIKQYKRMLENCRKLLIASEGIEAFHFRREISETSPFMIAVREIEKVLGTHGGKDA